MSILNGAIERRQDVLALGNLRENPFPKAEPPAELLDRVFVGREVELRRVATQTVDRPRNVLVIGGYGLGKTTFLRKLLAEMAAARRVVWLTGYAPLRRDSPEGLCYAALDALSEGALAWIRRRPDPAAEALQPLYTWASRLRGELRRLEADSDGQSMPDIALREGLEAARQAGAGRVVLAIDEIDKRDAAVVQNIVMGARHVLDLPASFLLTGRRLDVLSDAHASELAAFDDRVELHPFSPAQLREIGHRNLATARLDTDEADPLRPFDPAAFEEIVTNARGLPRPLNLMLYAALEQAIDEATHQEAPTPLVVRPAHLRAALVHEGNLIYNELGADARALLNALFKRRGYVSGADLDTLEVGADPTQVRQRLERLSQQDALLVREGAEGVAFVVSPTVEAPLHALQATRQRQLAAWDGLRDPALSHQQRGAALEDFAADLFAETFSVARRNVRTDTEELDLALEPNATTDPRFTERGTLLVECKNLSGPVDQKTVSAFATKIATHGLRQGFLLSASGFTEDARQQVRYIAPNMQVEIVLLDGATIRRFLGETRPFGDLLVELHRDLVLRTR